jgi:hypothetical protein
MAMLRTPRVSMIAEGKTRSSEKGEDEKVRRSLQAVACRKRYAREPGRSHRFL